MLESYAHLICAVEFSDVITKWSTLDNVRLTLLRLCVPAKKTSVVLERRYRLELVANWERVTAVQQSVELTVPPAP